MVKFLRENWVWIVAPIVVVVVVIFAIWHFTDEPGVTPFVYNNF